jgi:TRAP-type C4-dicarboxylate transport system substrate-binding protein
MINLKRTRAAGLVAGVVTTALVMVTGPARDAVAETTLVLSTLAQQGSEAHEAARRFAETVAEATDGRIGIEVHPASRLGDWAEVHEAVVLGSVDLALQPLSTQFEPRLAINWFPYTVQDYASARAAFTEGGYIFEAVDAMLEDSEVKILAPYGVGMGGAGFTSAVAEPRDPDTQPQGLRVRVWPGGTTHLELMKRFGFRVATFPWAELDGALRTGLIDGVIGGTPQLAAENFKDVLSMWIQYNDHFEIWWLVINRTLFSSLSAEDQEALLAAAGDIAPSSFDAAERSDQEGLEALRAAGVEIVELSEAELAAFTRVAREDVWPKIADEIGPEAMAQLNAQLGLTQ